MKNIKYKKIILSLAALPLLFLQAEPQNKKELLELFDLKQYLPSKRYDSEMRKNKELVELSLWVDQSEDKRVMSSLMTRVPAKGVTSFEWLNSTQNTDLNLIGIIKGSGVFVSRDTLKGKELRNFQMLFVAKKGYSSKLYFSDYSNAEGLALRLYVRVDRTEEPVNAPLQITAYNLDEGGKAKFYMEAVQGCSFDGVLLDEAAKSFEFRYKKSNSEGECTELNKLESSI